MPGEEVRRYLRYPLLLVQRDGRGSAAEPVIRARLHFHEHDDLSVASHDVDFATPRPIAPCQNRVPAALELGARQILTRSPEGLASVDGHKARLLHG